MPEADEFKDHVYIYTFPSGNKFHLYGGDPDEIELDDMLHSTARQCRFNGYINADHYSVLEHQIHVAVTVALLGGSLDEIRQGLFHDMSEAYLSDVVAPWKGELTNFKELEDRVWWRIAHKFDIQYEISPIVHESDWLMLFKEAKCLGCKNLHEWVAYDEYAHRVDDLPIDLRLFSPEQSIISWKSWEAYYREPVKSE